MLSYLPKVTLLRSGELRFSLTSKPIMLFLLCHWFTRALEVLYLLGMGFINGHLVGFRFLRLVRIKSIHKLILLKLCLPLGKIRRSA